MANNGGPGSTETNSPSEQLASALVAFNATGTSNTVTVQLQPAELGKVQITVTTDIAGPSTVQVVADRPETLALLQRDQAQLSQALDQAGIPGAGRTVTFNLANANVATNLAPGAAPGVTSAPASPLPEVTRAAPAMAITATQSNTATAAVQTNATPSALPGATSQATPSSIATTAAFSAGSQTGGNNAGSGNPQFQSTPNPGGASLGTSGGGAGNNSAGQSGGHGSFADPSQPFSDLEDSSDDASADAINPTWLPNSLNILA